MQSDKRHTIDIDSSSYFFHMISHSLQRIDEEDDERPPDVSSFGVQPVSVIQPQSQMVQIASNETAPAGTAQSEPGYVPVVMGVVV